MSAWMRRGCAVLGVGGVAAGCALFAAPAAFAEAEPPTLPQPVVDLIAKERLHVEMSEGWEAVTGRAAKVDRVGALAESLGVGSVVVYSGRYGHGEGLLIFTGNHIDPAHFGVSGATIHSFDNATEQTWYVFDDDGRRDARVEPGVKRNIKPVDAQLSNVRGERHHGPDDDHSNMFDH